MLKCIYNHKTHMWYLVWEDLWVICYAKSFHARVSVVICLLDQCPLHIMSSLARKFGMSHLLPTETVIYPTGQHQHHVEPCSFNQQPQNTNNQQNEQLLHKFSFCQRNNNQDQPTRPCPSYPKQKEYQQQKKSLPTSIKMDTTPSDKLTSVPVSNNSRVGK